MVEPKCNILCSPCIPSLVVSNPSSCTPAASCTITSCFVCTTCTKSLQKRNRNRTLNYSKYINTTYPIILGVSRPIALRSSIVESAINGMVRIVLLLIPPASVVYPTPMLSNITTSRCAASRLNICSGSNSSSTEAYCSKHSWYRLLMTNWDIA